MAASGLYTVSAALVKALATGYPAVEMMFFRSLVVGVVMLPIQLRAHGVRIFEYTPAFLHAKVACVDETWATVGSSNIDPLSLLLNLEANVIVRDADFAAVLRARLERVFADSTEVTVPQPIAGWRRWFRRGLVAWVAHAYLRLAGVTGRY